MEEKGKHSAETILQYDPVPWLMAEEGLAAVRARRMLRLGREDDGDVVGTMASELLRAQLPDGSFGGSPMKTAAVLNLLDDMRVGNAEALIERAVSYLLSVLTSQPGYEHAREVRPGSLLTPCDLCGFFGPYEDRDRADVMIWGAQEMNVYREYEPLLGPKSPVRGARRSSLDRAGASSCYAWGLIPLSYIVEALCRAGYACDDRLQPPINALMGAQRERGGWCRNLGGHPGCTVHAVRALGSHPELRQGVYAERALAFMRAAGMNRFEHIRAASMFDLLAARGLIRDGLAALAPRQRRNGTFGTPCRIERVAAVLCGQRALERAC